MGFFLGIDGGGTKTSCLIGDDRSVLGSARSGASNVVRVGEVQSRKALAEVIDQACSVAKVDPAQITRACVGAAGAARPEVVKFVRKVIAEIVGRKCEIEVVGDMIIALQAPFGSGPGVIVIAGTGSIAYGRSASGATARAGGWGHAVSDEGSGHWIGRAAVARILRASDESEESAKVLLEACEKSWGVCTLEELVLKANASPSPDFAELFPAVLGAADSGDELATAVLSQAGSELAKLGGIVVRRLFPNEADVPVAMSGGIFANSSVVREVFYNELSRECPSAAVNAAIADPVQGALERARNPGQ